MPRRPDEHNTSLLPAHPNDMRERSASTASGATFGHDNDSQSSPLLPFAASVEVDWAHVPQRNEAQDADNVSEVSVMVACARCYTPSVLSVHVSGNGSMGLEDGPHYGDNGMGHHGESEDVYRIRRNLEQM